MNKNKAAGYHPIMIVPHQLKADSSHSLADCFFLGSRDSLGETLRHVAWVT